MLLEIVNHCHRYPRLFAYQLSSLLLHSDGCKIIYSLFYDPSDYPTVRVLDFFSQRLPHNIELRHRPMKIDNLRNRAIGRNLAAMATEAEWVWFTDADYFFGPGIWSELLRETKRTVADLLWPSSILQTSWPTGDWLIENMRETAVRDVAATWAEPKKMRRAIGGIQIARGSRLRQTGYCATMSKPSDRWNFRSDVAFRRQFQNKQTISLPTLIRIRHTRKGYFESEYGVEIN